jgi:hypothetical protein
MTQIWRPGTRYNQGMLIGPDKYINPKPKRRKKVNECSILQGNSNQRRFGMHPVLVGKDLCVANGVG